MRALYLCYLSVFDAITHSQVIPYLEVLARRGVSMHLLTFERHHARNRDRIAAEARTLAPRGVQLHTLPYHKRPSLPATGYDVVRGVLYALRLICHHRIDLVHARSHVPAAMALALQALTGVRVIFDVRGLWAEEYVDGGIWRLGGINFRLVKWLERHVIQRADGLVVLTQRARELLMREATPRPGVPFEVIPTCVDLSRFRPDPEWRRAVRSALGLNDVPVLIYAGSLHRRYEVDSMVAFWQEARSIIPDLFYLLLTNSDMAQVTRAFAAGGVPATAYRILPVPPSEVPRFLAAADFSILLMKPCPSLLACYPTKIGECLASGLPIVLSSGIGDADRLIAEGVAAAVPAPAGEHYRAAARRIAEIAGRPEIRERCRKIAQRCLDLETVGGERYWSIYRALASV